MKTALISVIIPVYKVEKYLNDCIKSVVNQTYRNLEIILVDDGSPDKCPIICDEWAKKDKRINVIHKKNGGLSSARNAGIEVATGDYIGFVDSDDYVDEKMYEKLYTALINNDAQMSICNYVFLNENGNRVPGSADSPIEDELMTKTQAFQKLNMQKPNYWYYVTAFNKLYEKSIFMKKKFDEDRIHEDEFAIQYFIDACENIVSIKDTLYFYIQHENSIMTSPFTVKRLDAIDAFFERYHFFCDKQMTDLAETTLIATYSILINFMKRNEAGNYKIEIWKRVKKTIIELVKKKNLRSIKLSVLYVLFLIKNIGRQIYE